MTRGCQSAKSDGLRHQKADDHDVISGAAHLQCQQSGTIHAFEQGLAAEVLPKGVYIHVVLLAAIARRFSSTPSKCKTRQDVAEV